MRYPQSAGEVGGSSGASAQACHTADDNQLHCQLPSAKGYITYEQETDNFCDPDKAEPKDLDEDLELDCVHTHHDIDFDHTIHNRSAVFHEDVSPHTHTIYEPQRTRSIHYHEHRTFFQPIIDPNPTIQPERHWAQDRATGQIFKIPDELGRSLM